MSSVFDRDRVFFEAVTQRVEDLVGAGLDLAMKFTEQVCSLSWASHLR
jgi:hypothetical protein